VELHAVEEGVIVDRAGVGRASAKVSRSGSPVRARSSSVIDANGSSSILSISIVTAPFGRDQSR
jgi:hypothetical protein